MHNDLKEILEISNLPEKISVFLFEGKKDPGDGALLIGYFSEDYGIITITLYKFEEEVPDDITNHYVINEFENCIDTVFQMEEAGIYAEVDLLSKEVCNSTNKDCEVHNAAFTYFQVPENENEEVESTFSILFLDTEGGYFHKIRFSVAISEAENSLPKLEEFTDQWVSFVKKMNLRIN